MIKNLQELALFGSTNIGNLIDKNQIKFFLSDLSDIKSKEIRKFGMETLKNNNNLESVWNLSSLGKKYFDIIGNSRLNKFVDKALNNKAVVHSFNAIINMPGDKSKMLGFKYHRDSPFFDRVRTSLLVMIPLIKVETINGATQYIKGSHLFEKMPCKSILNESYSEITGNAMGGSFGLHFSITYRTLD